MSGNRAVTLQLNASNLLNMVNYAAIDTVVNSPTFGQVLSVRPMRSMQFNLRSGSRRQGTHATAGCGQPSDVGGSLEQLTAMASSRYAHRHVAALRSFVVVARCVRAGTARRQRQPARSQAAPVFRSSREVITVDAIVRDRVGAIVRGLTADDFEIREDGRPQEIRQLQLRGDHGQGAGGDRDRRRCSPASRRKLQEQTRTAATAAPPTPAAAPPTPMTSEAMAGRRLITLLFDVSSMQPEDVQRAVDSAQKYVEREDERRRPGRGRHRQLARSTC